MHKLLTVMHRQGIAIWIRWGTPAQGAEPPSPPSFRRWYAGMCQDPYNGFIRVTIAKPRINMVPIRIQVIQCSSIRGGVGDWGRALWPKPDMAAKAGYGGQSRGWWPKVSLAAEAWWPKPGGRSLRGVAEAWWPKPMLLMQTVPNWDLECRDVQLALSAQ